MREEERMFKDEFDVAVRFSMEDGTSIKVSEVSGSGLNLKIRVPVIDAMVEIRLNHEELLKLGTILQEAEKYINANK